MRQRISVGTEMTVSLGTGDGQVGEGPPQGSGGAYLEMEDKLLFGAAGTLQGSLGEGLANHRLEIRTLEV